MLVCLVLILLIIICAQSCIESDSRFTRVMLAVTVVLLILFAGKVGNMVYLQWEKHRPQIVNKIVSGDKLPDNAAGVR